MTYPAESFYRATIRESIDENKAVPFPLKVSKIPTLTSGLHTLSPNTSNEEIVEYNGTDAVLKTITIVKRGINPASQSLTTSGTDYNNPTYQKPHSQNDSIRSDVNHLHIIQDYGALEANKLNKSGGLRDTMGTAQNIGATNGSANITVADTTGWTNGASITGTGIPNGTTIVSFVPNTSAVLSNAYTGTTGTVSVIVGRRQLIEIDANNNEVKKPVGDATAPSDTDTIIIRNTSGDLKELSYLELRTAIASVVSTTYNGTGTDTFTTNNPAGLGYDGNIYNVPTVEQGTFTQINAGGVGTWISQRYLGNNTYFFTYMRSTTVYARAATLINNVWTYGTEVTLRTGMTANAPLDCAIIDTNKLISIWYETSTSIGYLVCTVSGTTITIGAVVTQSTGGSGTGLMCVEKLSTDRFLVFINGGTDTRYVIGTVSGTVPTLGTYTGINNHTKVEAKYLSDNYVALMTNNGGLTTAHRVIYSASGTSTTTTYSLADTATTLSVAICKLTNDSYAYYGGGTTINRISLPGAGTTLVSTPLVTGLTAVVNPKMEWVSDNTFGFASTILGYFIQGAKILNTFTLSAGILISGNNAACNLICDGKYLMYFNGGSANGVPTYVSLLTNRIIGAIQANSTLVLLNGQISTGSGLITGANYFSGNPLNNNPNTTNIIYGIALNSTQLLLR